MYTSHGPVRYGITAVLVGAAFLLSCNDAGISGFDPSTDYSLEVTPSTVDVRQGEVVPLRAFIVDGAGRPVPDAIADYRVSWSVTDTTIVRVTSTGRDALAYAVGAGEVAIDVEATPLSDKDPGLVSRGALKKPTKRVNVRSRAVPGRLEVYAGNNQNSTPGSQLPSPVAVRLLDKQGVPMMGARVDFVPESGNGTATPSSTETDNNGIASTTWQLGPQTGEHTMRVKSDGVDDLVATALSTDSPTPPPSVARVVVTPDRLAFNALGATGSLAAVAFNGDNEIVSGANIAWTSLNTAIATVDDMGRVTARGVGTALVVASAVCCSAADTVGVDVTQSVASLDVSPATLSLGVGASQTLSVTALDANQNVVPSPSVTWSTSSSSVATVSNGQVTAVAAGSAVIRAASGDARDSTMVTVTSSTPPPSPSLENECASPQSGWIWCDDFSQNRLSSYFEYDNAGGRFVRDNSAGVGGSTGMRATFASGQSGAGSLKLAFGATPSSYFKAVDAGTAKYREIYWRVYVRNAPDWTGGGGDKLSRAIVFANSNWAEAAIGHVWSGGSNHNYLVVDPASGTNTQGALRTTQYNDFANMRWLGSSTGTTPLFASANVGQWRCVETRMRLNDSGQSNGVFEMWIDGQLDAQRTGLNWLGSYNTYGINALFIENFWNDGAPKQQSRYFDNLVVSTQRIGCGDGGSTPPPTPPPPSPAPVASVTVTPSSASLAVGATQQLTATLRDANGNTLTGRAVTWSSSNTNVATVSNSGVVTARASGGATITALSENVAGTSSITVTSSTGTRPADLVEDFSSYTSTSHFLSDPRGIYRLAEDMNTDRMEIDTNVGYGSSNRSLRYNYPAGTATDYTISRGLRLPGGNQQELWVEAVVRFSSGFSLNGNGQGAGASLKLLHVNVMGAAGRFGLEMDNGNNGTLSMVGPNDDYNSLYARTSASNSTLLNGAWHVLRYHVRLGGTDSHDAWVNGAYVGNRTGATSASELWAVSLAKNLNMLAPQAQQLWWGKVSIWTQNPGW